MIISLKDLFLALVAPGLLAALLSALICVWLERKLAAIVQHRYGPYRVSKRLEGLLQPVADFIKLLVTEPIIPEETNKLLFVLLPVVLCTVVLLGTAFTPIAPGLCLVDSPHALLLLLAVMLSSSALIAIIGWNASDKFTFIGAVREVLQALAYEIVLILVFLSVVLLYKTGSIVKIVQEQEHIPGAILNPVAFVLYVICSLMATSRFPFEVPEAETEIVFGPFTEYSGSLLAISMLGVYAEIYLYALVGTCLFLGGWWGPFAELKPVAIMWTYLKTFILMSFMVFLRAVYPRLRIDQVLKLSTKWLVVLGLLACVISLVERLVL